MGVGAFAEPLIVVSLLVGGTWVNRARNDIDRYRIWGEHKRDDLGSSRGSTSRSNSIADEDGLTNPHNSSNSPTYLSQPEPAAWHTRTISFMSWRKEVHSPNTAIFADRMLSRLLRRFPFLVECWYWALIYWVYQLGRAFAAVTMVQGTVHVARFHALQLIRFEKQLGIFWEPAVQNYFLRYPTLMHWINRTYSFIHIPGSILFLVWLYYTTITSRPDSLSNGPAIFQARRRTMAFCNLIAFAVFTAWPCMPPRLLSDPMYHGPNAQLAKSYGFVDTVHGAEGESSVWTTNKFCNQYAAMPSLHFGYSLLIGVTIGSMDRANGQPWRRMSLKQRASTVMMKVLGFAYPTLILVCIVATANHFILDAVAGAAVCGIAWRSERALLNLLPLEDWFLWCLRMHKPDIEGAEDGYMYDENKALLPVVLPK